MQSANCPSTAQGISGLQARQINHSQLNPKNRPQIGDLQVDLLIESGFVCGISSKYLVAATEDSFPLEHWLTTAPADDLTNFCQKKPSLVIGVKQSVVESNG